MGIMEGLIIMKQIEFYPTDNLETMNYFKQKKNVMVFGNESGR